MEGSGSEFCEPEIPFSDDQWCIYNVPGFIGEKRPVPSQQKNKFFLKISPRTNNMDLRNDESVTVRAQDIPNFKWDIQCLKLEIGCNE